MHVVEVMQNLGRQMESEPVGNPVAWIGGHQTIQANGTKEGQEENEKCRSVCYTEYMRQAFNQVKDKAQQ